MNIADRIAFKFREHYTARRVANRFFQKKAMSLAEAKQVLGFPVSSNPSDNEVNRAYRAKFIENRKLHPDSGGDPDVVKKLNIAKDTLQGKLRERHERYDRPSQNSPPGGWRDQDRTQKKPDPPPPEPRGTSFQSALTPGVDWRLRSSQSYHYELESHPEGGFYRAIYQSWVLIGLAPSSYVALKITKISHTGGGKTLSKWQSVAMSIPFKTDLLKALPKVFKGMLDKGVHGQFKFSLLEGAPSEKELEKRETLSLKDALLGAELVSADVKGMKGRKIQIELEPVFNRERYKANPNLYRGANHFLAYDWFLYVNGKKTLLDESEVKALDKSMIFAGVWNYDYEKGKKNLTRLRGGRLKFKAKDALEIVAKCLRPGAAKDAVQAAAEQV